MPNFSADQKSAEDAKRKGKKHAVVVIHGMGEQHPMSTLRSFVKTVWQKNPDIRSPCSEDEQPTEVWTKPDRSASSYEMQRITTRYAVDRDDRKVRVDFYEFYWAHHTVGTTWTHLKDWVMTLLLRGPRSVPKDVMHIWAALWLLNVVALILFLMPVLFALHVTTLSFMTGLALVCSAVLTLLVGYLARSFGDVARYVRPAPDNIRIRHDIREAGVRFLRTLNDLEDPDGQPRYERITVVGHSLGSIIAYDLLSHFWAERAPQITMNALGKGSKALARVRDLERMAMELMQSRGAPDRREPVAKYHQGQRSLFRELCRLDPAWKISDFVSIGSPLSHAEFLLAKNEEMFRQRIQERSLSACPPVLEWDEGGRGGEDGGGDDASAKPFFSYQPDRYRSQSWVMHHAAVFAPVRWTNIYDDDEWIVFGDVISGRVGTLFGDAVDDIEVKVERPSRPSLLRRFFTHTSYWRSEQDGSIDLPLAHIRALQRAVFGDVLADTTATREDSGTDAAKDGDGEDDATAEPRAAA